MPTFGRNGKSGPENLVKGRHCRTDTVYIVTVTATVYTVVCHGVTAYTLTDTLWPL